MGNGHWAMGIGHRAWGIGHGKNPIRTCIKNQASLIRIALCPLPIAQFQFAKLATVASPNCYIYK
ncbi:hypothetical protein [Tolypothrix sp. VBCCA 56010]|uniref:hypothetical protein n=1 Tax=Tolypothrix sp. VBCCA 56010 TaxID=3137731 RepID=UPI003D7D1FC7